MGGGAYSWNVLYLYIQLAYAGNMEYIKLGRIDRYGEL